MKVETTTTARWRMSVAYGLPAFLILLLLAAAPMRAMADELVINGDFEEPDLEVMGLTDINGNGWTTFFGQNVGPTYCDDHGFPACNGGTLVPGWDVYWSDSFDLGILEPGRIEIQRGLVATCLPCSFNQKAELDSHHRVGSSNNNVTLVQTINTCPRMPYTLTFSWRPRTAVFDDNDMLAMINDDLLLSTTSTAQYWTDETYHFISPDQYGSDLLFEAFGLGNTFGMLLDNVSVEGIDAASPLDCQPVEVCGDKPANLELLYNGPHSDGDVYTQDPSEVVIETFTVDPLPTVVFIKVFDHQYGTPNASMLFAEEVLLGEKFEILDAGSDWNKPFVPPRITIEIRDTGDNSLLQRVTFHTSCSQPLDVGDQFGGIAVWGFTPRGFTFAVEPR